MDLEARSLPPEKKSSLLSKLREYKADLNKLKSDVKKVSSSNPDMQNRAELGLVGDSWSASSAAQRERLLQTTDRINKSGDNIRQSKQTLLETEVRPHSTPLHSRGARERRNAAEESRLTH